ncbi:MAG: 1-(5-phosphoribosyl)-5-[(5-phosphoribosylamino)methylideneamino]imidazole-4-carboxamide isomerase [Methanosarcinaceae archaeon]|nr:1-(5-phosphoribosyl)-5-[(5-phosphoribosylamino)methylideneamino]imidazole-4-carboxamide isomerase [Methanosarcinaceae archaeon]
MFEVIPAVDIKDGKCVQLRQGVLENEMISLDDPAAVAKDWISKGAKTLHLIDLDGAINGVRKNSDIISEILEFSKEKNVTVQIGGGIRSFEDAEILADLGADRVILSTVAIRNPEIVKQIADAFGSKFVIVALDSKDGKVAIDGWKTISEYSAVDVSKDFEELGAGSILFTNIDTEGLLSGIETTITEKLVKSVSIPVIASGGVTSLSDIVCLKQIGTEGVVVGSALYTGKFTLKEAIDSIKEKNEKEI